MGTSGGEVYIFDGAKRTLKSIVLAHRGGEGGKKAAVLAMAVGTGPIACISGGGDGTVRLWGPSWESLGRLAVPGDAPVVALSFDGPRGRLLCGTMTCELHEVRLPEGPPRTGDLSFESLVSGHHKFELWGLACHPCRAEFATVGDDQTLRVWDAAGHAPCAPVVALPSMARACAYLPFKNPELFRRGFFLAVGFGGSVGRGRSKRDGCLRVYRFDAVDASNSAQSPAQPVPSTTVRVRGLEVEGQSSHKYTTVGHVIERNDAHEWISDLKFSPDGRLLAVGSHDNKVYVYHVLTDSTGSSLELRKGAVFAKHSSYITHLDFSVDARYLQSTCGAYELLFSDTASGRQMTAASDLKDVAWDTWTCPLGWPVQGIWPPCADGTDVNTVARSHSQVLLATGDDFGKVKLFNYPCVPKGAHALEFSGHSSHVTNVRWAALDEWLVSTGGNDRCVFQWRHKVFEQDDDQQQWSQSQQRLPQAPFSSSSPRSHVTASTRSLSASSSLSLSGNSSATTLTLNPAVDPLDGHVDFDTEKAMDAEEAVLMRHDGIQDYTPVENRPWKLSIEPPDENHLPPVSSAAPRMQLKLEWIHGFGIAEAGNNLFYSCHQDGEALVFHAASYGIVLKSPTASGPVSGIGPDDAESGCRPSQVRVDLDCTLCSLRTECGCF